jgi:hypothetical protein
LSLFFSVGNLSRNGCKWSITITHERIELMSIVLNWVLLFILNNLSSKTVKLSKLQRWELHKKTLQGRHGSQWSLHTKSFCFLLTTIIEWMLQRILEELSNVNIGKKYEIKGTSTIFCEGELWSHKKEITSRYLPFYASCLQDNWFHSTQTHVKTLNSNWLNNWRIHILFFIDDLTTNRLLSWKLLMNENNLI